MHDVAIRVQDLEKVYRIGAPAARYNTLRDSIADGLKRTVKSLAWRQKKLAIHGTEELHALKDISFDVRRGEVVGIIGRNGAGKSTLLKILSRITEPTRGHIEIRGRVGALLEVGTGFHPELTGRENIFLNGAILGMKRVDITRQFDEIVAFSEVERFIDTPVKHYSSGMYMRLAFAVAAHLEPEILIVDEVLAVGDATFQKKCLGKMENVAREGRTVLFVSHNMAAVRGLCTRAVWLRDGQLVGDGDVPEVVAQYTTTMASGDVRCVNEKYGFAIDRVALWNGRGEQTLRFEPGDDLIVDIAYNAEQRIDRPLLMLTVHSTHGPCFSANMLLDGRRPDFLEGAGRLYCRFKSLPLLPQDYFVTLTMRTSDAKDQIISQQEVGTFSVTADLKEHGFHGDFLYAVASKSVPVVLPYEWTLPDGSVRPVSLEAAPQERVLVTR